MSVVIVDYGLGNLLSVHRALDHLGVDVCRSGDPALIADARHIVLPGVGAFGEGMRNLAALGLDDALRTAVRAGTPVLGICLGMQLLFDRSAEFGSTDGLGFVPGAVELIPATDDAGRRRVPLVGWLRLHRGPALSPLLDRSDTADAWMYFVHSYRCMAGPDDTAAVVDHEGATVCAMVHRDNIHGCQFHPEKSGRIGLRILKRFVEL